MSIRVGMIGAGAIANDHCSSVNNYSGAEMVAVADLSKARREALKTKYDMDKAHSTWEELVADKEIDAVTIALPNALHAEVALAAIRSGKHVMLDKPFALSYAEAKRVADAAKKKGITLMVGMNQRYNPDAQVLRTLVKRGELGEIFHIKAYMCRRTGSPKFGTWFVNKALSGGGCLLDIGVHILDLGLFISDHWDPVSVSGQTYSKFGHKGIGEGGWGKSDIKKSMKFDVDDSAMALIRFRNGATLELNASWVLHQEAGDRNGVELFGEKAGARTHPVKLFRFGKKKGEYEIVEPQHVRVNDRRKNRHADWLDAIHGKRDPICTVEQALTIQKLLDAIYKSSASGREVRIR